jgi:predicted ATPase
MIALIEAKHYKCLRYVHQRLAPFQVLIGPNASGKSTFLDVVSLLGDLLRVGPERAVEARARSCRELVWMQQDDAFELAVTLQVPNGVLEQRNGQYHFCRYEVRIGVNHESGGVRLLAENFWLMHQLVGKPEYSPQRSLFPVEPEIPESIFQKPYKRIPRRKVVSMTEEGRAHFRSETTDWNFPLRPGPEKAALTMVPEEEERFPVSTWAKRVLTEGVQVLALNSLMMRNPCRPDAPKTFQPDGSNLPIVIKQLKENHVERFNRWLRHVQTVLPDIREMTVNERGVDRHLYLTAKLDSGISLPSWLLSDGTLRFLALTLLAYLPQDDAVYLIEEPENGIHPRAVEAVFQSLSSAYDKQILVATHSPLLLGLAKPEQILCFARTDSGATDVVNGREHPHLKHWRGEVNLGDLYAAGVLE